MQYTPDLSKTMENVHVIQMLDTDSDIYSIPEKGDLCTWNSGMIDLISILCGT